MPVDHKPSSLSSSRTTPGDGPAVEAAERKIGAVLADLEADTGGEVRDLNLEQIVDSDPHGRPVLKKKVDVKFQPRPDRHWAK
jgi:hypothetical protein